MQKWSTGKSDDERCSETRKSGKCNTPLFLCFLSGKDEKIMKNAFVFAQMEGHKNQEIDENGRPEGEKCCRGSKSSVAALGNAGCSFCIEGRVLGSEMDPEMTPTNRLLRA